VRDADVKLMGVQIDHCIIFRSKRMNFPRWAFPRLAVAVAGVVAFSPFAAAQNYPARPITMVVPFPAGGPTDVIARILADHMRTSLGQPLIVENVAGVAGSLGVGRVAHAMPDGYTISIGHWQTHVLNAVSYKLNYDVVKDFEPVSLIADTPQWIVARKTLPAKDLKELIAWLKDNPGKATSGTVGLGGPEVTGIYFQKATDTSFTFVPYRGGAPLNQDLVGGQIDFSFNQAASTFVQVRDGSLKAYAVMAKTRWSLAPDVPTIDEAGFPGLYASFWHGMWVPKGTSQAIVSRLNSALRIALADPTVQQRFADQGQNIPPPDQQTPVALAERQQAEIGKWWPIMRTANVKGE
jgi:tripartite-type tricarboxylate transporter receptor subunit TctC